MHTTNYVDTFIAVAPDSPAESATEPAHREPPTIAELHYELIAGHPYRYTSDDVVFETHARRAGIPEEEREAARAAFFSKGQPCLRSSPLGKRLGWGTHHDAEGRVALVAVESDDYARLAADASLTQTRAMRSSRAG
ncbi:DUF6157 family protein [Microbacterium sp. 1P10UB]|uniref:DUF6157 family protein n=1 Tax=unclassified Microbacterium TaxID=2609290 RepID=UPI0039A02692